MEGTASTMESWGYRDKTIVSYPPVGLTLPALLEASTMCVATTTLTLCDMERTSY